MVALNRLSIVLIAIVRLLHRLLSYYLQILAYSIHSLLYGQSLIMDIVLAIVWILAMVLHSFSSDYALNFPAHNNRSLPLIRWGSLLVAIGLSAYLAKAYQAHLQGSGIWVFFIIVFVIIALSKIVFRWVLKRQR